MTEARSPTPRRRGRPSTIDRAGIVAAARRLDPRTLTLQAVADDLGVQRQSLSYHVADRDELLRLVAVEEVAAQAQRRGSVESDDWRQAARRFATSLQDAVAGAGILSQHVRLQGPDQVLFLAPAEQLISSLFDAGLNERAAVGAVNALIDLSLAAGRASAAHEAAERLSLAQQMEAELLGDATTPLPALRRAAAAHAMLEPADQFEFDLDLLLRGLASLIDDAARD
ncbi:TetR/AcrR family transcriptional regulator C-terminal domain-containing protein [Amnibacterium flavum]|nr:TetR/AcrR family transcriptional regulator C-terminal domain-containing protein [Amnibacterium flavum]